jgi:hypothetical protein
MRPQAALHAVPIRKHLVSMRTTAPVPRTIDQLFTNGAIGMSLDPIGSMRHLRSQRIDWLLSVLTGVLALLIFAFAPFQATGIAALCLLAAPDLTA